MASDQAVSWSRPLFIAGIGLSGYTAGIISSISLITIPTVLTPTPTNASLLKGWRTAFYTGGSYAIPFALTAALTHALNAYVSLDSASANVRSKYLAAAALLNVAIVPYTVALIIPTNTILLERVDKETEKESDRAPEEENVALVRKWQTLNFVRAGLPALGGLVAALAL